MDQHMSQWILNYLTGHPQYVRTMGSVSSTGTVSLYLLQQCFRTLVIKAHCPVCFRTFPAQPHLIQMTAAQLKPVN